MIPDHDGLSPETKRCDLLTSVRSLCSEHSGLEYHKLRESANPESEADGDGSRCMRTQKIKYKHSSIHLFIDAMENSIVTSDK